MVDYNYNVAERRSVHVLKTLQEDEADAGSSSRASSTSGPASLRRRKKRRKAGSSASDSSGQSNGVEHLVNGIVGEPPPPAGYKYVKASPLDPTRVRPQSATATLTRERPTEMDAQQQLMQPRTPPMYGSFRPQGRYHRRVMSSNQAGLDEQPVRSAQSVNGSTPNSYQGPDGRVYTLPTVHKGRAEKRITDGPMIPLDPKKDVLPDIEGGCFLDQ